MQIASQPTADGAQSTYQDLARRYGSILGGKGVNIVRADIPGKGTYYRVRIPSSTRNEAISLCEKYKAAGGSCFVSK
ncbi:MAG: SPOR domain-containing protein [Rhizobiaceae bacterium]|nr:SPOR domain-containing protein [Rhizobiaceae bacterium]